MRSRSESKRPGLAMLAAGCLIASLSAAATGADDPGTIGVGFRQIFDERQPNHRGPLVVLRVQQDSPAARAGVRCSDFVVAVNGEAVTGREMSEILKKEIRGPVGGTVRLGILRADGSRSEISLTRAPFPPHRNPTSDPFAYVVPGPWSDDPRYAFPLPWSPELAYHGVEDLFYVPNFAETDSPEYHSYVFFLWLEGDPVLDAARLESDMLTYFRGLARERGRNYAFAPDLSKVTASYREDPAASRTYGGVPARTFSGSVSIWDTHGKVIRLNSEVAEAQCPGSDHTALFFGMSIEPRDGPVWKAIDAVRDTFRCGSQIPESR